MAALSYALGLTQESAPFNINVGTPKRGVRDVRGADPTEGRGSDASHLPVLIRGREETGEGRVKTFLRNAAQYLGSSAGIQTKRMREDYELLQGEAGQAYEERQEDERKLAASTFTQIGEDALRLESYSNAGLDELAGNLRRDAAEASWQYENFRDPEMRAAALTRLQQLQAGANQALDAHVNAGLTEARTFAREELKDLRRSINEVQGAYSTRRADAEAMRARLALVGTGEIEEKSAEGQAILTEAFERMTRYQDSIGGLVSGAGNVVGAVPGPWGVAASAAVSAIGQYVSKEGAKLNYSDVIKAFEAQQTALDRFTNGDDKTPGFLPQLLDGLSQRESYARDRLGIPIDESWRATQFQFPETTPLPVEKGEEQDYSTAQRYERLAERARRRQTR